MIFACISTAWVWNQKNNFPLCGCSSNRPCSAIRSLTCCYQHHVPKPVVCLGGHFRTQPIEIYVWVRQACVLPGPCEENFLAMSCAPMILCVCKCLSHFLLFFPQMNLRVCQWISRTSKLGGGWCTAKASTPQISKMLDSLLDRLVPMPVTLLIFLFYSFFSSIYVRANYPFRADVTN